MSGLRKKGPARRARKAGRNKSNQPMNIRGVPAKQAALNAYLSNARFSDREEFETW